MIEVGRYFPRITIDNFFTEDEFEYLSNIDFSDHTEKNINEPKINRKELDIIRTDKNEIHNMAIYHHFNPKEPRVQKLFARIFNDSFASTPIQYKEKREWEIKEPKDWNYENPYGYKKDNNCVFFPGLRTTNLHILQSFEPYTIHHDFSQEPMLVAPNPAWTMIIPLEDYNSHTINFKQQPKDPSNKVVTTWIENEKPPVINGVSAEEEEKYFKDWIPQQYLKYLEIDGVYKWKKNKLYAASRYSFHSSDNFIANGLTEKRAIVMWTSF